MFKLVNSIVCTLLLTGCATIFTGTNQAVNVDVIDQTTNKELDQVKCNITDSSGMVYNLGSNPGAVVVSKSSSPLQVRCDQDGYQSYTGVINSNFNSVTLLNIFFWPCFFVDMATGAMTKYPGQYSVLMRPEVS
jgi:hypothetical protein